MECKFHITVTVKVPDSISTILLLKLSVAVFSKVLAYLFTVDVPKTLSVDSLKRSIWLEF
jgi:hypothetical protein